MRIPLQIVKQLQLHAGSPVTIEIENGRIVIQSPKYDLDTMLNDITPENLHGQMLDDEKVLGNEEW